MTKHLISVLAFMAVTFAVQGSSHFLLNKDHFAAVGFLRGSPIMLMGFSVMIIQGLILSLALSRLAPTVPTLRDAITISLGFGLFLASYIVLTEPAKYAVPSILDWIKIEATASAVQFGVFGILLGWIHRKIA
ncbi:hypothetical protein [Parasedimentitalea psychrophila]|uniref:Uncharacterized protein n=1 Tax=Parasedimentitalea psychrophila TaxID=2997337 RepID=A0A9Y2L161_9RHOB|nr:hypothetical protein [Parasedimentitalea psychrophila]WIY25492.1 hypothetical protein QPJ95_00605 [Parasedimentitalea psychrophila]